MSLPLIALFSTFSIQFNKFNNLLCFSHTLYYSPSIHIFILFCWKHWQQHPIAPTTLSIQFYFTVFCDALQLAMHVEMALLAACASFQQFCLCCARICTIHNFCLISAKRRSITAQKYFSTNNFRSSCDCNEQLYCGRGSKKIVQCFFQLFVSLPRICQVWRFQRRLELENVIVHLFFVIFLYGFYGNWML